MPTGLTSSSAPRNPSVAYSTLFDVHRGTLNYSTTNLDAALAAGYAEILIIGDSVAEGWTHLDTLPPYNHTADFPNAWPRIMASSLVASTGKSHGGTGMVRPGSAASSFDPEWAQGGWSASGIHFIASSTTTQTATFTANYAGTGIAVAMAGTGTAEVTIDGVVVGTTTAGGSATAVTRTTFTGLSNAKHAVGLRPVSGTAQCLGVDVYTPGTGIRVHNMSQGGATASGTGQAAWADSSSGSPANMLPAYDQTTPMFGRAPHAVIICVGGNDVHADITPAVIAAAHDTIGTAFTASGTDIILLPDAHGSNVFHADSYNTCKPEWTALMQLAVNKGWSYIDFDWLTGGFDGLAGHNPPYTGDDFGHLNVAGAAFFGNLMTRVVLNT
jgi:lysophospholipase L1-like esterase